MVAGSALLFALASAPQPAAALAKTASERLTSLARAASDPGLAGWQREFYRARLDEALAGSKPVRDEIAAPLVATDAQPVWSVIADTPRRWGHSLVLDDATGRLYAFGGSNGTSVYNTVFVTDPAGPREWHPLLTLGAPPPTRMAHAAVLDRPNHRMVVFGGTDEDGSYLADVWALSLDGTATWTEITPTGDSPTARANFVATVDTLNDRMILFGGANGGFTPLSDLWSLSLGATPTWTALTPGGTWPSAMVPAALLVDELRHRLALVGVQTVNYSTSWVLWALSLNSPSPNWSSWVMPYQNAPPTGSSGYLLFTIDQAGDRLACVTGDYYTNVASMALAGSASQWTNTAGTGSLLPARFGRACAYDAAHRKLFVSGGGPGQYSSGRAVCDVAALDLAGLSQWTSIAGEPGPRYGHGLAYDATRGLAHMFGGQVDSVGSGYSTNLSNDLWSIPSGANSPAWSPEAGTGGPLLPRSGASLLVDPVRDRLLLFGGTNGNVMTNELWQRPLSGGTVWSRLVVAGTLPHQRANAACVYDPVGDRLVVYGGYDAANGFLDDLWTLSLAGTPHWTKLAPDGGPLPCRGATFTWDPINACAYLVGGYSGYSYNQTGVRAGTVWKLSLAPAPAWQSVSRGLPAQTSYPEDETTCSSYYDVAQGLLVRVAYVRDYYNSNLHPVVSTLAPAADTAWTTLAAGGTPPPPHPDAQGVFDTVSRRLVWFGGIGSGFDATWALSFGAPPLDVPPAAEGAAEAMRVAPNPARASCSVRFALPRAGRVRLELLDLSGRRVRGPMSSELPAGPAQLELRDLGSLPAGVYFARLSGAIERRTRVAVVH
jgi:hypothetical protein